MPKRTDRNRDVIPYWTVPNALRTRQAVEASAADLGAVRFERWMNCSTHAVVALPQTSDTLEPYCPHCCSVFGPNGQILNTISGQ